MDEAQMRAARALLGWSQTELAEASGLSLPTIKRMEKIGPRRSGFETVEAVEHALEKGGVQFIAENGGGPGVRLAKSEK
ncbi:helix-turn-helix domain-containing protein [Notoacmeibacter ruber]|uniref:XRE family transcriptional regulator n=1 Tax=Notoacmeibacter ruber TaxID=2670375 RepID=A0A3L7J9J1_9HYPH|nr:helix-turn-helix transcriptional regulator [Notoacmeibacter ruber]RLQ87094.1 XRE family transcriptional regulator [Notoacmeibacter ruber]